MPHHGGRRSECLFRSARWGRGRADHLDLAIARGRDLVAHVAGQNDATVRSGPGILHRVAVDQESVAAQRVGARLRREGHNMGTVRRRVVRWADAINAPGIGPTSRTFSMSGLFLPWPNPEYPVATRCPSLPSAPRSEEHTSELQ